MVWQVTCYPCLECLWRFLDVDDVNIRLQMRVSTFSISKRCVSMKHVSLGMLLFPRADFNVSFDVGQVD